jgi:hypothetical protein
VAEPGAALDGVANRGALARGSTVGRYFLTRSARAAWVWSVPVTTRSSLSSLETLAAVYLDQGRPERAIAPLERALAIDDRQPPTLARQSAKARQLLARARAAARRDG